ncbi:MAG: holliday junction helicase RuvA [Actinomycetota bacterium]|jgi:Holliday junction DNA helicase RuvA|nr:holliday junction helicase RuvA [Actinomycetota bacterium]
MIAFLEGLLSTKGPDFCLIDVNGVGYRASCSSQTLAALPHEGERVRVWTHTYVREEALALYGFATQSEQRIFEALLGVSGVGPKVALQLCSGFSPEAFRKALVTDDVDGISSIPGIGKKTAQRILLDLKEKLELPDLSLVGSRPDVLSQARSALENLGYSPGEVRAALGELQPSAEDAVSDVIKSALKVLAS